MKSGETFDSADENRSTTDATTRRGALGLAGAVGVWATSTTGPSPRSATTSSARSCATPSRRRTGRTTPRKTTTTAS
ncbi:hypothetical protein DJ71_21265, partial [Halorubrum sp. E3]